MLVHWKSLICFGLGFWALIYCTDVFGKKLYKQPTKEFSANQYKEDVYGIVGRNNEKMIKFGWSLLIWNTITLLSSIILCYWIRTIFWLICSTYRRLFKSRAVRRQSSLIPERSDSTLSKIPVMVKPASSRLSDSHLKLKYKIDPQGSCPNLLSRKVNTNTKVFHTIYQNTKLFTPEGEGKFNKHVENQCAQLREEIARLQANSLREHAVLTRRLEIINREKKDLTKQLTLAQKENRAAKQQLEELLQEKGILVKRLDSTTREFKTNTKAKKMALAKLEEVTTDAENLKQQLEQTTRDKEILENKLKVLEIEYEQLQERHRATQNLQNFHSAPERDTDGRQGQEMETVDDVDKKKPDQDARQLASVSQSELEMKKIGHKIKQLQRNLENLNESRNDAIFKNPDGESEISLSLQGNNTDNQIKTDDETDISDQCSPTRYWGGRAGDMVTHIQAMNHKMNDKFRLTSIKGRHCPEDTELDDYSCAESLDDIHPPKKIVSSSMAFQQFLKNLSSGYTRRESWSRYDWRF